MKMWKPMLPILSMLVCFSEAYKILLVTPTPSRSHDILNQGLIRHLTKAGHEITYIAFIPQENPLPGVTVVDISDAYYLTDDFLNVQDIMEKKFDINEVTGFLPLILQTSRVVIEHPRVQKLMADKTQEFDVVIAEFLFNAVYAGFSGLYNCPLIWFSPTVPNWMVFELIDEATNPAYSVGVASTSIPPLTFTERVAELGSLVFRKLIQTLWSLRFDNDMYEKNFVPLIRQRRSAVPTFESLAYNGSLVLSNYHYSTGISVRAPQNLISIGGFHIDQNVTSLPKDLQKLMDDAKDGVIYFSLGSNMKSKHFPSEIKRDLLNMFGKLKQTVIWKFEEDLPNRPNNVHTVQWAPQQSILAHKNCVIFITHGGLLSTTEAIHFGVPIIGIPGFYDQFVNIQRSVIMGFAKKVDLTYSIVKDLELAIEDILEDPKYTSKAHELSEIYHDRTVPPGKEIVHWVEHVIKTRGAIHLRSPAFLTPWYQKLYLDLVLVLLIVVLMLKYALRFMCRCTKTKLVTKDKQKKN
nr:UDP-glucuronosyltransferase 2B7-like [Maniola hyperantus]